MRTEADQLDELMRRYGGGEDDVFDELYRLPSLRLYRFCLRLAMREPEPPHGDRHGDHDARNP